MSTKSRLALALAVFLSFLVSNKAHACACGCGVFDVSTSGNLPNGPGGTVWIEHNYMKQDENWRDTSSSNGHNHDKKIRTNAYNFGGQYMFNRSWGIKAVVPVIDRQHDHIDHSVGLISAGHKGIGDVRLSGIYSGFSPDMSTGVTFGAKLPTGKYQYGDMGRDTALGSGSTNVLLGAYHMDRFSNPEFGWFVNALMDRPVINRKDFKPGAEANAAVGSYYEGWSIGKVKITPVAQIIGTKKWRDGGEEGEPEHTGYHRIAVSPGVEFDFGNNMRLYTDVSVPVYQRTHGNQVVAPVLVKTALGFDF